LGLFRCATRARAVDIEAIDLHYDWGYNIVRPLAGALPEDFPEYRAMHIALDHERMIGRMPWGREIPLRPFFGVMAVAPPPDWGTIPTPPPRRNGGNMDNKELVAGTKLYLRFSPRARFSRWVTVMARRATARSASRQSKPASSGRFV
jgi:acetamidase/formamidase